MWPESQDEISIHAPTKGATQNIVTYQMARKFQSTHPQRVRRRLFPFLGLARGFQSTHPQRVRPLPARLALLILLFQSTHPQRVRRCRLANNVTKAGISIHAPTKGATAQIQNKYTSHNQKKKCDVYFCIYDIKKNLNFTAFLFLQKNVYLNLATYNKSNPSASYDGFAPICSVLLLYLFPRL